MNTFRSYDLDHGQHYDGVSFAVEGCLKFDLSTRTPNDPKMTSDQKFLNTLKEPLAKNLFNLSPMKVYRIM